MQSISFGRHVMLAGEQELFSRWKREVKELAGAGSSRARAPEERGKGALKVVL